MSQNSISGSLEFNGSGELATLLKSVHADVKLKGGRAALRKAGEVLRSNVEYELKAADDPGTDESIWRNAVLRFSPKRFRSSGDLMFRIGMLGGAKSKKANEKNPGGDTFYWRFIEFGTINAPAQAPLRTAAKKSESDIVRTFITQYKKSLTRAIKKASKGAKKVKL